MFILNKYLKIYVSLIDKRRKHPYDGDLIEIHHITPKCFGGDNSSENLVKLSAREHYIAHRILVKITEGRNKEKMIHALWGMSNRIVNNSSHTYMSSKVYESARMLHSTVAGNHTRGKTYEEIYGDSAAKKLKQARAQSVRKHRKGKTWEEIYGTEKAAWMKERVSLGANKRKGIELSQETKNKIRDSSIGRKYRKLPCPICSSQIPLNNMKRHVLTHQHQLVL